MVGFRKVVSKEMFRGGWCISYLPNATASNQKKNCVLWNKDVFINEVSLGRQRPHHKYGFFPSLVSVCSRENSEILLTLQKIKSAGYERTLMRTQLHYRSEGRYLLSGTTSTRVKFARSRWVPDRNVARSFLSGAL
jgi:hypothetical protein